MNAAISWVDYKLSIWYLCKNKFLKSWKRKKMHEKLQKSRASGIKCS